MPPLPRRIAVLSLLCLACSKDPPAAATSPAETPVAPPAASETPPGVAKSALAQPGAQAEIGKPAPDFTLPGLDGKLVQLSSHLGKTVVLEWFNPECPFVVRAHTKGSLVDAAQRHTADGIVWLAVNSAAAGKQGHGVEVNQSAVERFKLGHPLLLDESGEVGKAYGATNTPHMYVIDPKGSLVYRGAIDNSPDGEQESPEGGKLVRYVDAALADLAAGREVQTADTKAYGCSVKYASQ